jgi:hypothetical protein
MKFIPQLVVAALLGLAVSLPAQVSSDLVGSRRVGSGARWDGGGPRLRLPQREVVGQHGFWQTVQERVWVPGYWHEEPWPPVHGWVRLACGRMHWGVVAPGGCHRVWVPPRWELRSRQVWVPAPVPHRGRC